MPSPIGHALGGIAAGWGSAPRRDVAAAAILAAASIAPDLDLEKYRESLLESHQHLKLELLDPNGSSYKVQLRSVFVPQTVRDCQEYVPQVFEIPKEHLARLRKRGWFR